MAKKVVSLESDYVVTLSLNRFIKETVSTDVALFSKHIRANNEDEALGMVIKIFRDNKEYNAWVIGTYIVVKVGV